MYITNVILVTNPLNIITTKAEYVISVNTYVAIPLDLIVVYIQSNINVEFAMQFCLTAIQQMVRRAIFVANVLVWSLMTTNRTADIA